MSDVCVCYSLPGPDCGQIFRIRCTGSTRSDRYTGVPTVRDPTSVCRGGGGHSVLLTARSAYILRTL